MGFVAGIADADTAAVDIVGAADSGIGAAAGGTAAGIAVAGNNRRRWVLGNSPAQRLAPQFHIRCCEEIVADTRIRLSIERLPQLRPSDAVRRY